MACSSEFALHFVRSYTVTMFQTRLLKTKLVIKFIILLLVPPMIYFCIFLSLWNTCAASSKRARPVMLLTAKNAFGERSSMELVTSLQVGSSSRRPNQRSLSSCRSPSWTATRRPSWQTRQPPPRNSASSLPRRSTSSTSLASRSTSRYSIRCLKLYLAWIHFPAFKS